jgi:uncharacterized protein (DUF885 family)
MRSLILLVALGATFATSAQPAGREAKPATGEDARFARHVEKLLDQLWKQDPESAFQEGYYKYSDRLEVPDAASRAARLKLDEDALATLRGFDERKLSIGNRVDLVLLRNQFESDVWYVKIFRDWQWQPSQYNVGDSFARQLTTEYAPLEKRLRDMLARLGKVPAYYPAARKNIDNPTLAYTELALDQNNGALGVFGDDLVKTVEGSKLTNAEKVLFKRRVAAARTAIQGHVDFLTDLAAKLKQGGARSFRIGKELYAQKYAFDLQSGYTAEQLYEKALAEKASLQDRMEKAARDLWPEYLGDKPMPADRLDLIGAVIGELSRHHTSPDKFVETIRNQLPELERFVREHDLVDQDASRPLLVRETPLYLRGFAGAGVNAPGPYDPTASTYYNVTPLDGYTPERAESFLREYNDWALQVLNIHEAIPGHYVQFVHANKSKSLVKTIFGNCAMIEGWAVYGERMMMDAGYGGSTPEMWLMWMKWNLRAVANTIIDYQIQTGDLTKEQMVTFLTREAFQSEAEATAKWRRATLSQVQLASYFSGYSEITALRDEEKARLGEKFSLRDFNNKFLSYGSAPVRYIRELMREGR